MLKRVKLYLEKTLIMSHLYLPDCMMRTLSMFKRVEHMSKNVPETLEFVLSGFPHDYGPQQVSMVDTLWDENFGPT